MGFLTLPIDIFFLSCYHPIVIEILYERRHDEQGNIQHYHALESAVLPWLSVPPIPKPDLTKTTGRGRALQLHDLFALKQLSDGISARGFLFIAVIASQVQQRLPAACDFGS